MSLAASDMKKVRIYDDMLDNNGGPPPPGEFWSGTVPYTGVGSWTRTSKMLKSNSSNSYIVSTTTAPFPHGLAVKFYEPPTEWFYASMYTSITSGSVSHIDLVVNPYGEKIWLNKDGVSYIDEPLTINNGDWVGFLHSGDEGMIVHSVNGSTWTKIGSSNYVTVEKDTAWMVLNGTDTNVMISGVRFGEIIEPFNQTVTPTASFSVIVHRPTLTRVNPALYGAGLDVYNQLSQFHTDKWNGS